MERRFGDMKARTGGASDGEGMERGKERGEKGEEGTICEVRLHSGESV